MYACINDVRPYLLCMNKYISYFIHKTYRTRLFTRLNFSPPHPNAFQRRPPFNKYVMKFAVRYVCVDVVWRYMRSLVHSWDSFTFTFTLTHALSSEAAEHKLIVSLFEIHTMYSPSCAQTNFYRMVKSRAKYTFFPDFVWVCVCVHASGCSSLVAVLAVFVFVGVIATRNWIFQFCFCRHAAVAVIYNFWCVRHALNMVRTLNKFYEHIR